MNLDWIYLKHFNIWKESLIGLKSLTIQQRLFGQLVNETHPHVLEKGQVTPGITKAEYFRRRCDLMKNILQGKPGRPVVALVPSAGKLYMAPDVPYPFRQNSDFLYLCGFQEPDSVLVLTNIGCKSEFIFLFLVTNILTLRVSIIRWLSILIVCAKKRQITRTLGWAKDRIRKSH